MLTEQELLKLMETACDRSLTPETELFESGYLDSLAMILLGESLEEHGLGVSLARIPRESLRNVHALWGWLCENDVKGS